MVLFPFGPLLLLPKLQIRCFHFPKNDHWSKKLKTVEQEKKNLFSWYHESMVIESSAVDLSESLFLKGESNFNQYIYTSYFRDLLHMR